MLLSVKRSWHRQFVAVLLSGTLINPLAWAKPAEAQVQPGGSCQLSAEAIAQKDTLRQSAASGDRRAQQRYTALVARQAGELNQCRSRNWPQRQAIWLRLYPCDASPGALEALLDRLVNKGYNEVYIESFYNGQVLLPTAQNRTSWPSMLRVPGYENRDLLAESIAKGRARGLKVYAWMFSMNFGYTYAQRPTSLSTLAINGHGQTSLTAGSSGGLSTDIGSVNSEEAFIDPYSLQAKQEYYLMEQAILQRHPDGILFDYIRYPKGTGAASIASRVQDLWIYGPSSQQALLSRALNRKGQDLIHRFLTRGYITVADVQAVDSLYPQDGEPMWQGRRPPVLPLHATAAQRQPGLQADLWQLSVAHAVQGVIDFLAMAVQSAQQLQVPAGAVFFPEGNQAIGQGYDSRLQPWDRFPSAIEWHPMSYATCGNASCVAAQVQRVVSMAAPGTQVMPVLAGAWGQSVSNRPSLEAQMQAIRQVAPQITSVSHFAYSWQEPQSDRDRKFCQLR